MKYDVFDYCISNEEACVLNAISNHNATERFDDITSVLTDPEDIRHYQKLRDMADSSVRDHRCYYALKDESLIKLTNPYLPE